MKHAPMFLLALAALAACDSRATASGGEAANPKRLSAELESCGATSHCAEGLRCWDRVCMREGRSTLGDFHAARAARYLAAGDADAASVAYADALAAYEHDKLGAPPDVDCAYGQALLHAKGDPGNPELAAKVLHRCLLSVPAAVALRSQALSGLAELEGAGLDPAQIARSDKPDRYLTRAPTAPSTDKLAVTVTADPMPRGKTYSLIPERLAQPDARAALVACWEKSFAATKAKTLEAKLGVEVKYKPSEYDDEPGTYAVLWSNPPGGDAEAQACVRAAVEPMLAPLKLREAFQATLTISVK